MGISETNTNKSLCKYTIEWSTAADENVKLQQSNYMRKHGEKINKKKMACKLLEVATLPKRMKKIKTI